MAAEAKRRTSRLPTLDLRERGDWDPSEEYWGEPGDDPVPDELAPIIAAGARAAYEMEQVIPGADLEDPEDDIIRSAQLRRVGLHREATRLLQGLLRKDYRCIDAHAHLGNVALDRSPARALRHFEMGVAIGEMTLPDRFDGVLPWGWVDNRPFLRAMHGFGISLWRLGRFDQAGEVFGSLLWLNPEDHQSAVFNLRSVRGRLRWHDDGDSPMLPPGAPTIPGVLSEPPPPEAEVRASAAAAPILARLRAFVRHVEGGRRLTKKGNLSLADARILVGIAATGDRMETRYGDRTFGVRSSEELGGLSQLFAWARAAGLVRVVHGAVQPTRRGSRLALAADPAPFFNGVADALMQLGPLASQSRFGWGWWEQLTEMIDGLAPHLLLIGSVTTPVPAATIIDRASFALLSRIHISGVADEELQRHVANQVLDTIETLVLAGLARWERDRPRPEGEWRWRRPLADRLFVTPAGHAWLRRHHA